jgi:hypothetical protein
MRVNDKILTLIFLPKNVFAAAEDAGHVERNDSRRERSGHGHRVAKTNLGLPSVAAQKQFRAPYLKYTLQKVRQTSKKAMDV